MGLLDLHATGLPHRVMGFSATHPPAFYAIAWLFTFEFADLFGDVRAFLQDAVDRAKAFF